MDSELNTRLLQNHIVIFVLQSSHQSFNLMALDNGIFNPDLLVFSLVLFHESLCFIVSHRLRLLHVLSDENHLGVFLVNLALNCWVHNSSCMYIFHYVLVVVSIEFQAQFNLGFLLLPKLCRVLSYRRLQRCLASLLQCICILVSCPLLLKTVLLFYFRDAVDLRVSYFAKLG